MYQDKTVQTHVDRILKTRRFEKSEINELKKLISGSRFGTEERKIDINTLLGSKTLSYKGTMDLYRHGRHYEAEVHLFPRPCKITAEQTKLGKEWLLNRYFKKNGGLRKCAEEDLNNRQVEVIKSLTRFEFVGMLVVYTDNGGTKIMVDSLPIYKTFGRVGGNFAYSPIHWEAPVIFYVEASNE